MDIDDGFDDITPLRGYFKAVLAQFVFDSFFCVDHFSLPDENDFHLENNTNKIFLSTIVPDFTDMVELKSGLYFV
jgi:hypothetical protein